MFYGTVAGIMASANGDVTISGCVNKGTVSQYSTYDKDRVSAAGILAGPSASAATVVENCYNIGSVSRSGGGGYGEYVCCTSGVVCQPQVGSADAKVNLTVRNCYNAGTIGNDTHSRGEVVPDRVKWASGRTTGYVDALEVFTAIENNYAKADVLALGSNDAAYALGASYNVDSEGSNPTRDRINGQKLAFSRDFPWWVFLGQQLLSVIS